MVVDPLVYPLGAGLRDERGGDDLARDRRNALVDRGQPGRKEETLRDLARNERGDGGGGPLDGRHDVEDKLAFERLHRHFEGSIAEVVRRLANLRMRLDRNAEVDERLIAVFVGRRDDEPVDEIANGPRV